MPRTRDINPHNRNGHRRRQLVARIKATSTHCALCGQPLNPDAPHQDPTETVIDEDIPRSRGGDPLDPDKLATLLTQGVGRGKRYGTGLILTKEVTI